MGWKNVKEHYRIGHSVHVRDGAICIGSPYIPDLIIIGMDGVLKKRHEREGSNEDLDRYMTEFDADPAKLKQLVAAKDTFTKSIPVYTYDDGEVVEKKCEELGWPNATHDGEMMYDNMFFRTKAKAVKAAKEDAECGVKWRREAVERAKEKLDEVRAELVKAETALAKLNADYPSRGTASWAPV